MPAFGADGPLGLIIQQINSRDFRINNLFQLQLEPPLWRCNLRTSTLFHTYGEGPTMTSAIQKAFNNAKTEKGSPAYCPPISSSKARTMPIPSRDTIEIASALSDIDLS